MLKITTLPNYTEDRAVAHILFTDTGREILVDRLTGEILVTIVENDDWKQN